MPTSLPIPLDESSEKKKPSLTHKKGFWILFFTLPTPLLINYTISKQLYYIFQCEFFFPDFAFIELVVFHCMFSCRVFFF